MTVAGPAPDGAGGASCTSLPGSRILVRLPTWVGDAVMATPALRALRAAHPGAEIALEGRPPLAELLAGLPYFDAFLPDPGLRVRERARGLRDRAFDLALLLPDSARAALAPRLAGIPRRVGYARDPARAALLTQRVPLPRRGLRRVPVSMVERYLRLTRACGCPDRGAELSLRVAPAAAEGVAKALALRGVGPGERLLAVSPGAGFGPSKCWPPEHFAVACDGIAARLGLRPVLAPAPGEVARAREVASRARRLPVVLAEPALSLGELSALIARSALLLTNDTGPRQIAVALGRPAVVLMGPTDPRYTAHQLERQRVLREGAPCSPCHLRRCPIDHRCLVRLAPERAMRAAEELCAAGSPASGRAG